MTPCEKAAKAFLEAERALGAHIKQCSVVGCGPHDSTIDCATGVDLFRARSAAYSDLSVAVFQLEAES